MNVVFVPYNEDGVPQWNFANSDLAVVRESLRRYQGSIVFAGIYEYDCLEIRTYATA